MFEEIFVNHWYTKLIALSIILFQAIVYIKTRDKLNLLGNIFTDKNFGENDIEGIESESNLKLIIYKNRNSEEFLTKLISDINKYLTKNKGVIDFEVLKNIIERSIKSEEESASSNISLPLYIGLMGTFFGIIIGLGEIAFSGGIIDENINSFIGGVIISMFASFFGLLFTVLNNFIYYKKAKETLEDRKNSFLNFLQTELLPHLQSNLYQALNVLKNNINIFNEKFEKNIGLFDTQFASNIGSLKNSVDSMSKGMNDIVSNTNTQKQFLKEFKSFKFENIIEANASLLEQINNSSPLLKDFIIHQAKLNKTLENSDKFANNINHLLNRVSTFEESINNLGKQINSNELLGNDILIKIKKNLDYLDHQYELLTQHSNMTTDSIKSFFESEKVKIQELTTTIRREIESAMDFNIESNPLLKLNLLENMDKNVSDLNKKIEDENFWKENVASLMHEINLLKENTGNLKKLENLEEIMKRIESGALSKTSLTELLKDFDKDEHTNNRFKFWK